MSVLDEAYAFAKEHGIGGKVSVKHITGIKVSVPGLPEDRTAQGIREHVATVCTEDNPLKVSFPAEQLDEFNAGKPTVGFNGERGEEFLFLLSAEFQASKAKAKGKKRGATLPSAGEGNATPEHAEEGANGQAS